MVNIRSIRKKQNLSQKELAERVHLSQTVLCRYELGVRTPRLQVAKRIADALGCTVDELIEADESAS